MSYDELFDVNSTGTVPFLNLARTASLVGPVHVNANGYYAVAGLPHGQDLTIRAQSESASHTAVVPAAAISFGGNVAATNVTFPNQRPEIIAVVPLIGGSPVKTAAPGGVITLKAVTRDGNGDPLEYS